MPSDTRPAREMVLRAARLIKRLRYSSSDRLCQNRRFSSDRQPKGSTSREPSITQASCDMVIFRFQPPSRFHADVVTEVRRYFATRRLSRYGDRRLHAKTAVLLLWWAASYWLLVFIVHDAWRATILAVSLGFAMAGIGFNISHDAIHNSYSRSRRMNGLASMLSDFIGVSSYLWRWKHNYLHHRYTTIIGIDSDVNPRVFRGLSPNRPRIGFYRLQPIYLWFLYGFLAMKWHLIGDLSSLIAGRIGDQPIHRPRRLELAVLLLGKLVFFLWIFGVPLARHPIWVVGVFYSVTAFALGLTSSVVFQLAHCVEEASFPVSTVEEGGSGAVEVDWAVHQVQCTVDFSQKSKVLTWFLGGLNFQIEHHLFPGICHIHYPALAPIVERCCRRWGIRYSVHRSVSAAIVSHYHFLGGGASVETHSDVA